MLGSTEYMFDPVNNPRMLRSIKCVSKAVLIFGCYRASLKLDNIATVHLFSFVHIFGDQPYHRNIIFHGKAFIILVINKIYTFLSNAPYTCI